MNDRTRTIGTRELANIYEAISALLREVDDLTAKLNSVSGTLKQVQDRCAPYTGHPSNYISALREIADKAKLEAMHAKFREEASS